MLRRQALRLTGMASIAAVAAPAIGVPARVARAEFVNAPDVVLFCDPALRGPMQRLGAMFRNSAGVPVRIFSAPGLLMAAQLARNERSDILISLSPVVQQLAASGIVHPQPAAGSWRNRLVIAGRPPQRAGGAEATAGRLTAMLGERKFGVPDPGPYAVVDAPALLGRLGLGAALAGRIIGEVDTGGVAWLLAQDQVKLGLILATDARDGGFAIAARIPDEAYPPLRYAAAFNRSVLSRNAEAFMRFFASDPARTSLSDSRLETES